MNYERIQLLVVSDDPVWRERGFFRNHPRIRLAFIATTGKEGIRWAGDSAPDAVIVDHSLLDMTGLEAAERIAKASPGTQIFLVTDSGSLELWKRATAIGIQQVFTKPVTDADLGPVIEDAVDQFRRTLQQQSQKMPLFERGTGPAGKFKETRTVKQLHTVKKTVVAVLSPKGGVGKTTMTVNMACAVAAQADINVRVAIVDFNEFGNVTVHLNLSPPEKEFRGVTGGRNLYAFTYVSDWAMNADDLKEFLLRHESGVWVLPSVPTPETLVCIDHHLVKKIIELLRQNFDLVILDISPTIIPDASWASLEVADYILLVVTPDPQVVSNMAKIIPLLENLGVANKCYLIVNMLGLQGGMDLGEIKDYLSFYPILGVINEYGKVREAVKRGTPLVLWEPNGEFAQSVRAIVNKIFPVFASGSEPAEKRKGFLGSLFKKLALAR